MEGRTILERTRKCEERRQEDRELELNCAKKGKKEGVRANHVRMNGEGEIGCSVLVLFTVVLVDLELSDSGVRPLLDPSTLAPVP